MATLSAAPPDSCPRCLFPPADCLCGQFEPVPVRTEFVLLRHAAERRRRSNSGRAVANLVQGARVIDYGAPDSPLLDTALPGANCVLLWPEGPPATPPWKGPVPGYVLVLDATWQQARRMRRRVATLASMPTLHVASLGERQRLRITPAAGGISTLEAVAAAIELFEGEGAAASLLACYDRMVEVLHARGRSPRRRY